MSGNHHATLEIFEILTLNRNIWKQMTLKTCEFNENEH